MAAKSPGRIQAIFVDAGDFVTAGQVMAQMDADVSGAARELMVIQGILRHKNSNEGPALPAEVVGDEGGPSGLVQKKSCLGGAVTLPQTAN